MSPSGVLEECLAQHVGARNDLLKSTTQRAFCRHTLPQWDKENYASLRKKMFEEEVENRAVLERAGQHIVIDRLVRAHTRG